MNKILILVDAFTRGGIETHIASEIRALSGRGIEVHLGVGNIAPGALVPVGVAELVTGLEMGPFAPAKAIVRSTQRLAEYLQEHDIPLVHAHPFSSYVVGYLAASEARSSFVCTVHAPLSLLAPFGPAWDILLRDHVLPGAGRVVCVSPEAAVTARLCGATACEILGNPVAISPAVGRTTARSVAVISRLDEARLPGLADLFRKCDVLAPEILHIYGDGDARETILAEMPAAGRACGQYMGWSHEIERLLSGYSLVAGMGRVVLEAGAAGRPALLVGADGVKGLLHREGFTAAARTNFSGRGMPTISGDELREQLDMLAAEPERFDLRLQVEAEHAEGRIWEQFTSTTTGLRPVGSRGAALLLGAIARQGPDAGPLFGSETFAALLSGEIPTATAGALGELKPAADREIALTAQRVDQRELERRLEQATARSEALCVALTAERTGRALISAELDGALRLAETEQAAATAARVDLATAQSARQAALADADTERTAKLEARQTCADLRERLDAAEKLLETEQLIRIQAQSARGVLEERLAAALARPAAISSGPDRRSSANEVGATGAASLKPFTAARSRRRLTEMSRASASLSGGVPGLVSVVLPVYNQANYLAAAVEGVLAQTYSDWELIIVDDGSKDDVADAVSRFAHDPRVRLFHQPNQRLPSALNNGFRRARGSFLTWTSADNVMLPHQLEVLLRALESSPTAGLAYSNYEAIDDRGAPLTDPKWREHNRMDGTSSVRLPAFVAVDNFHASEDNFLGASFLWRADIHAVVGCHDENLFGGEDYDFWLRMNTVTAFVHVPDSLYKYRVHDNTLNARAKELNIRGNVERLLSVDRDRRSTLLKQSESLAPPLRSSWRPSDQYRDSVTEAVETLLYTELVATRPIGPSVDRVRVLVIDVALRIVDLAVVSTADIVVVPDDLTFFWLKRCDLPWHVRLLAGTPDDMPDALAHACALRLHERGLEASGHVLATKPPAAPVTNAPGLRAMIVLPAWGKGGMEQVVVDLCTGLQQAGSRVTLAVAHGDVPHDLQTICAEQTIDLVALEGQADRLVEYVTQTGVGVVNYHHCALAADQIHSAGAVPIYTMHNAYIWFDEARHEQLRSELSHMSAVIAVSRQVAEYGRKTFGVDASRLVVIPNGTTLSGAAANRAETIAWDGPLPGPDRFSFLNVATFNRVKLQDRLLRAFAAVAREVPDVHLTLIGAAADESFFEEVTALRSGLGLADRVAIIPGGHRSAVHELMRSHHCFVLPSLVEGWSISLLEAAMLGMPAVVTDVGSARDLASRSSGIRLIPALDSVDGMANGRMWDALRRPVPLFERTLAAALSDIARDRESAMAGAALARSRLSDEFSVPRMVDSYLSAISHARSIGAPTRG
ncbi:glycosyltransferase [Enterovirga sp. CN4-39]|uniref:glycosyltransferase n=1 Tax=Enterovirga sp. CN4-39 TaxID=3400910 RepID=UPI003C0543A3